MEEFERAVIISFVERVRQLPPRAAPLEAAAVAATWATPAPAPRLADLLDDWCAARKADGNQPRGVARYREQFCAFVAWAGADCRLDAFTTQQVRAYKTHLGNRVAAGTTRNGLTALRAFGAWCVDEELLEHNPALAVKHPRVVAPPPNPLRRVQITELLAICDAPPRSHKATWARNGRCVALMLYAGLRREEAAKIRWGDYDPDRRELIVRRSKFGASRVVAVCRELAAALAPGLALAQAQLGDAAMDGAIVDQGDGVGLGKPLTHKSIGKVFERWLAGRGMPIGAHQLRKTFATELYARGVDLFTIQRLLGHVDPKTTLRYIGASGEQEHAAVERLTFRAETTPPAVLLQEAQQAVDTLAFRGDAA